MSNFVSFNMKEICIISLSYLHFWWRLHNSICMSRRIKSHMCYGSDVQAQCINEWSTLVPLSAKISVNSPNSFPRSRMFEQNTWEQGWILCHGPQSLSTSAEAAVPRPSLAAAPSWWIHSRLELAARNARGCLSSAASCPAVRKDPGLQRVRSCCLSFSLKEHLTSLWLTSNVRQRICGRMGAGCNAVWFSRDKPSHRPGGISGLGDRDTCWQGDSGSIPGTCWDGLSFWAWLMPSFQLPNTRDSP